LRRHEKNLIARAWGAGGLNLNRLSGLFSREKSSPVCPLPTESTVDVYYAELTEFKVSLRIVM